MKYKSMRRFRKGLFITLSVIYLSVTTGTVIPAPNVYAASLQEGTETGTTETDTTDTTDTAVDSEETVETQAATDTTKDPELDTSGIWALDEKDAPSVQAASAILIDAESGAILYAKNIHTEQYPASITKLLTCLIAKENCDLDETVTFTTDAVYGIEQGSSNIGIDVGETLTMEQSLYAILLASANEVALAVADHVAGSKEAFADMMNEKAKELGCENSNFVNPNGLPNDAHYTSAYDMALIAQAFFADQTLSDISGTTQYHISATATQPDDIDLMNHHRMLKGCLYGSQYSYDYTVGGKTGYTNVARETLVTCAEKDGKRLICVILKDEPPYHYEDTEALFEYGFNNFQKLDAYSCLGTDQIDTLIKDNLGDVEYTLNDTADIMVPDGVEYSQLSTDIDKVTEDQGTGHIRFYYQNREAGNIAFTYEPAPEPVATETVEENVTPAKNSTVLANIIYVIGYVVAFLLIAIFAVLLFGAVRFYIQEQKLKKKRQQVLERCRKRRQDEKQKATISTETIASETDQDRDIVY